ncbi:hypothetical protein [Petroclostridium sp. X23]|uniref:hypothetical protein n=1 Tax=Petroclostridium sp. X23 TaxID=3045146 RepID=UPI0024ADA0BD|nr:hypothetical protein [Petroclostridium sp. X23]WHH60575.1 hypothetical protein QKW49_07660 [Petroclostridium sp. X23]
MEPLGFLLGIATFGVAKNFKQPLRKAAVFAASQAFTLTDRAKGVAYGIKEEFEDIVAEAHYEHMKRSMMNTQSSEELYQPEQQSQQ